MCVSASRGTNIRAYTEWNRLIRRTYDFPGRLQIRSCLVARYTVTQSLSQSDYNRFTRESPDENAAQLSERVRANKANETRLSLIFDCVRGRIHATS